MLDTNFLSFFKRKWHLLLISALLIALAFSEARVRSDFDIYYLAAKDLLAGKNIYTTTYFSWYHYYYSTFFALILVPFTLFPLYFVKVIWFLLNVFLAIKVWKLISRFLPLEQLNSFTKKLFIFLAFAFIAKFLRDNLHVFQITIFILFLTLKGLSLISEGKVIKGAFLLALGIDIKILPLVFLPYLIYRGEWKAFIFSCAFLVLFALIPCLFIGIDYTTFLIAERWHLINPSNEEHILDTLERSFHSLTTVLSVFLVENSGDKFALPVKRNIADISLEQLSLVINIVRAFFILLTLYFLRSKPFEKHVSSLQRLYEISYICLIIPLIFPHQQHYAFIFVFPAVCYVLFFTISHFKNASQPKKGFPILLTFFLTLIFFLLNSHFILGTYSVYYDHFKTMTFGVLLLLLLLIILTPRKFSLKS